VMASIGSGKVEKNMAAMNSGWADQRRNR